MRRPRTHRRRSRLDDDGPHPLPRPKRSRPTTLASDFKGQQNERWGLLRAVGGGGGVGLRAGAPRAASLLRCRCIGGGASAGAGASAAGGASAEMSPPMPR